ncbi:hypothetical protein V495_02925 [Pseudogymnoascus sp. VKM F-4514 (FW-929)]|nr:hypothetical protein V495_02925 [Pseudogymnoascus sp. VKM F-4514 (FW-929)]KFY61159.1 hypothetical protein V497_03105 [Pseudogymnoascus sp. VKM F-4516 (FW-969)]
MPKWLEKFETVHFAYLILTLVVTTSVFSMVGCISESPGIYQLFIAELPVSNVQFGYIGICSTVSDHDRVCKSAIGTPPADLAKKLGVPIDVIQHVLALQRSVSLALPALSGILIFCGVVAFLVSGFCNGEESVKTRRRWMATTRIVLWGAVGCAFAAAYSLTFSISAMEVIAPKSAAGMAVTRGQSLQILQWMVFSFTAMYVSTIHYMLHKVTKQTREGILPIQRSRDAGTQTTWPESPPPPPLPKDEPAPRNATQTSTGTQGGPPVSPLSGNSNASGPLKESQAQYT